LIDCEDYKFVEFESAGTSIGGLDIPIIKVTNNDQDDVIPERPIIVIIGRQHTGETHSSFIIHGFTNHLLSRSLLSHKLRQTHEIWILPIVNPDGVVIGNYRSNLQGKDMNRHFFSDDDTENNKSRAHECEIIRSMLKEQFPEASNRFKLFLDIHAHSAATSIFMYCPMPE
jgi:cytosolic carboxypeptidase protein 2/3